MVCPACGGRLTLGVLNRVEELSSEIQTRQERQRPCLKVMPLVELLALMIVKGRKAKSVAQAYHFICNELGGETRVLVQVGLDDLKRAVGKKLANVIIKIRAG